MSTILSIWKSRRRSNTYDSLGKCCATVLARNSKLMQASYNLSNYRKQNH